MSTGPRETFLNLKAKGDLAELRIATDLRRRGHGVAFPFGEDHDFDLILIRSDRLERVQVKYTQSDGRVVRVKMLLPLADEREGPQNQAIHRSNRRSSCRLRHDDRPLFLHSRR